MASILDTLLTAQRTGKQANLLDLALENEAQQREKYGAAIDSLTPNTPTSRDLYQATQPLTQFEAAPAPVGPGASSEDYARYHQQRTAYDIQQKSGRRLMDQATAEVNRNSAAFDADQARLQAAQDARQAAQDARDAEAMRTASASAQRLAGGGAAFAQLANEQRVADIKGHGEATWPEVGRSMLGAIVTNVGSDLSGMAEGSDAITRSLRRLTEKVGAERAFDMLMAPSEWTGITRHARAAGESVERLGAKLDVQGDAKNKAVNIIANATGQLGGQIVLSMVGGKEAAIVSYIGQGFDQIADAVRQKQGEKHTAGADAAILAGGIITAVTEKLGVEKLMERVPPAIRNRVVRGVADVAIAGGYEAAQEVTEQFLQNAAIKLGVDKNQDLTEGFRASAIGAGGAGAIARLGLGLLGIHHFSQHRPLGIEEQVDTSPPPPSPDDESSPIDTSLISQGRQIMRTAAARTAANDLLQQNGAPSVGTRVSVNIDGKIAHGTVEDGFRTNDGSLGQNDGIKIRFDDGTHFDEYFSTIQKTGIAIQPIAAHGAPEIDAPNEPLPGPLPGRRSAPAAAPPAPAAEHGSVASYLAAVSGAESHGNEKAANPLSSADGRFQFLDSTFRQYYQKVYGTDPGAHPAHDLKTNPEVQQRLMQAFTNDNAHSLERAGMPVNNSTLYAAHHFGAGGAIEMARNPNAAVDPEVVSYNPQFRGMTNGEALAWADRHLRGARPAGAGAMTAPPDEATASSDFDVSRGTTDTSAIDEAMAVPPAADAPIMPPAETAPADLAPEAAPTEKQFPKLDREAAPEAAARKLASELVANGFGDTNGIGNGYRFATDQIGILLPGHERAAKNSVTVEIDTGDGRQVFSFPKSQLASPAPAAAQQGTGGETAAPTITPTASGKGLIIANATPEHVAAIRAALPPTASVAPANNGTLTVSKKYEDAVRAAVSSVKPAQDIAPEPAPEPAPAPAAAPQSRPSTVAPIRVDSQPDLLGGPTVTAYEMDARREAPHIVQAARAEGTLDSLHDAARYLTNPDATEGDREQARHDLTVESGRKFESHDEAVAFAQAIQREIAPAPRPTETPGPVTGGEPADSFSAAGSKPSAPFRAPEAASTQPEAAPAYEPAGPVAARPSEMAKQAQLKTWVSKEFKAHLQQVPGEPPHRDSPVAASAMRGWVDGKANDLPQLRRVGQDAILTASTIRNPENSFNPRQSYLEAYYAARTGKHVEIRAKGGRSFMGAEQALSELDPGAGRRGGAAITIPPVQDLGRDDGRYAVDTGAVLTTQTGRKMSPAPAFNQGTPAATTRALNQQERWLLDEATQEARAAKPGSDAAHALRSIEGMTAGNLSPSDHDLINEVLFGDPNGPAAIRPYRGPALAPVRTTPEPTAPERTAAAAATTPDTKRTPSANKVFTDDAYEAAKKRMLDRMNRLNSIDPEMLLDGITMAGYHLERGARSFAAYAQAMVDDLGEKIVPNLRSFYEAIRHDPRAKEWAGDMSGPEEIGAALARLEDKANRGNIAPEEKTNASAAPQARPETPDRTGDEGAGSRNVPQPEGGRDAGGGAGRESGGSGTDLRANVERAGAEGGQRGTQPERAGQGERGNAGQEPGGRDGNRPSRRVRRADRGPDGGVNYAAPKGSLTRQGGWKTTAERNLDIVELVNKLDAEGRPATPEEQAQLAKFTGWGAGEIRNNLLRNIQRDPETGERSIAQAHWGDWKDLVNRARTLLKGEALEQALQSTQYAHYTSEPVIRSMWQAMERFGFKGGRIVEPGMGIGLFAVAAPEGVMDASTYTGIELDAFSTKIAGYLLPQENALHADFVKQKLPDGFFDVAIGNPPFSPTKVLDDPAYKKQRLSLHDYFFAKSIDKVRPGGLMVFVTSRYTMDKLNDKGRAYIADRADLLGAIRLPQTAFKDNAGTEVVTDVLFFQRRMPGAEPGGEAWSKTDTVTVPKQGSAPVSFQINEYYKQHPEMVLGEHAATGSMYGTNEYTVTPAAGDIADLFARAVKNLPENVYVEPVEKGIDDAKAKTWEADMRPASEKEGGLYLKDGAVLIRDSGVGKPVTAIDPKVTAADHEWLKGYAGVRDALKQAQRDQLGEGDWQASLKALNKAYDAFVKKHGPIQAVTITERKSVDEDGNETVAVYRRLKNQRLLDLDVESPLVFGLEKVADDGTVSKGQFLQGRTLNKPTRPKIESVDDALAVSLDEIGRLDLDYIAGMMKMDRAAAIAALGDNVYHVPSGIWQTSDEYLSGDVVTKLEEAKAAADADPVYERNVTALQKVQPKPLGPSDISVKLGAGWVPVEIVRDFAGKVLGVNADSLNYEPATAEWGMEGKGARVARSAAEEFGTIDRSPQELMLSVLNNQTIKVTRKDSDNKVYTDPEATAQANETANKITARFKTWVWEDAKRASTLLEIYNRRFNNLAPRRFDGSHLTLPGLSAKYSLYPHQKRAVWRQIQTGNTYLAHAVGAGKTLEMIVGGMEQKRLGLIKKPMYVVPNHMLNQFAREFMEAYPTANLMVADERAFHTDNRKRFMAQAALNAPDAVIITHSAFGKLGTSAESREAVVDKMIEELEAALEGSDTRYTRSKIEKQIEALKRNFEAKTGTGKDQALTFEEMGVDYLYVDEAHMFRKLDYATSRNVKGIDPKGSQRALDLYIKTRWLEQQRPGRSLTLASGTPVTNTMAEIYTVMRYMAEGELERDGLRAFDAWANMFGEVAAGYEQNAAGGYEIVERFAKFVNVPELMKRVRSFMDVLTSNDLGDLVTRPAVNTGGPQSVVSPPIDALRTYMDGELKNRIRTTRAWKPSRDQPSNPDPIIAINTDARLASIDMRFIHPGLPNDPGSKLNRMIDRIVEQHKAIKGVNFIDPATGKPALLKGGTQIVFSAVGFGEGAMANRGFDLRGWMDGRLMKEAGLKKAEIAWMSDANTHAKKEALFKDMRAGKIKVLIGSPANMGTGVNVQNRLKALHFLAPPWYPADVEQPHGRIIRQGNWNKDVDLYWYATKGTYDSTAWNMVSRKARFIEQAMSGDDSVRSLDDISEANQYEMAAALAAGDERIIQIVGYTSDIERLSRLQSAHADEQIQLAGQERQTRKALARTLDDIRSIKEALKARDPDAGFEMKVGDETFEKPGEAGDAMIAAIGSALDEAATVPTRQIATYQGRHAVGIEPNERMGGEANLTVTVGGRKIRVDSFDKANDLDRVGVATKIQNAVARLPSDQRTAESEQADLEGELKKIERKLGAPFPQEQELSEKIADRANLQATLAAETAAQEAADSAKAGNAAPVAPAPAQAYPAANAQTDTSTLPVRGDSGPVPARGGTVRGLGIAADIERTGSAAFVGRTVEGADQLAELAQAYRDPRYETFRAFFVKGGKIIHSTAVTARSTAAAPLMPGENLSVGDMIEWARGTMASTEADGYYLLHNHPSGEPRPSREDINVTMAIASRLPGFLGHVVINSNKYAVIDKDGLYKIREKDFGEDRLLKASVPHPVLGTVIDSGEDVAALGKGIQRPGYVTIVATSARNKVRAVVDYTEAELQRPTGVLMGALRGLLRRSGSTRLFLIGPSNVVNSPLVRKAVAVNILTEAIDENQNRAHPEVIRQSRESPLEKVRGTFVADQPASVREDGVEFERETEERFQAAKKGVGDGPGMIESSRAWWQDVAQGFTRHWKALPNEPRFSNLQQQLRKLEAAPEAATEETVRRLASMVKGFSKADMDLFTRKAVLDDLQWEVANEHKLPFGFTPDTLQAARRQVDAAVERNDAVASAIRRRKIINENLANEMVKAGVLTAEQIRNPAYYRHMVLEFARAEMAAAHTPGNKVKSPYWAKRMGSSLDINANLLEAEFDWMQKALVDIETAKTIDWIKKSDHNIRDQLRAQATASNKALIAEKIAADIDEETGKKGPIAKADQYFRQLIKRGMDEVAKEIRDGNLDPIPAHLQGAADALAEGRTGGDAPFALMSWILDNEKPGAMGAAMVLKGTGQRKAWMRQQLGEKYHDPEDVKALVKAFAPPGYSAWQPIEGQHLFTAKTISESTLDMFVEKLADTAMPGINHDELARALTTIRSQLVIGGDRYTMVLPDEVTQTLNEFGDRRMRGNFDRMVKGMLTGWKRWVLINPRRVLKYNLNNLTGDLDAIIAGNPGALRRVGASAKELEAVMRRGAEPTQAYKDAVTRGVFTSGLSVQEIPDINRLSAMRHLTDRSNRPDKLVVRSAGLVWRGLQGFTQWRENVFRYAAYTDYLAKLEAGQPMSKIGYGASVPSMVDAVTDNRDKAALLARDLVGDYGSISVAGSWLRTHLVPFWSWTEINTRRYWRLTSNAFSQSIGQGLKTGGIVGLGLGVRMGVSAAIKMGFLYGLMWMWNHLLHREDEEKLGDQQRRQMHLILGHDQNGEVMTLRMQGALSDVLGMLGFPDAVEGIKKYENGQGTMGEAAINTMKAPVNRLVTGVSPFIQLPFELATRTEYWPDLFDGRPIHDRIRHVAKAVNLENEYDWANQRPSRGYGKSWTESLVYRRDPGEMAYDDAKGIAYDWLEREKGVSVGGRVSPRSEALRDYRMSIRYGDPKAAERALEDYEKFGGTRKGLKTSIKGQDPLGPIPKKDRRRFVQSLTDDQYEEFQLAEQYYQAMYLGERAQ